MLRIAALAMAITVQHCSTAAPVFAQEPEAAAVEAIEQPAVSASPSIPDTPAPAVPDAPEPILAAEEQPEPDPIEQLIDEWFRTHFHGLGGRIDEFLLNHLRSAVDELKALLKHPTS